MYKLSDRQAQDIVDKMMQDIPYNINIMNEQGIIIGSGNARRIGTVHQGAVAALQTGTMVEVWQDGRLEKKGTNEPIVINGQRIGVIGISGDPDEVRPFCNLVRTTVTLLIEQRSRLESLAHEANRKKAFLEKLLRYTGSAYPPRMRREATEYGLDLLLRTTVLLVRRLRLDEHTARLLLQFPSFQQTSEQDDMQLIFVQHEAELPSLLDTLRHRQPQAQLTIGRSEFLIAHSYAQAHDTMNVLLALQPDTSFATYDQLQFIIQFGQSVTTSHNPVVKLEEHADLLQTLRSFIFHNGSIHDTALVLNIHRNTLQYRLKRIQAITGRDPRQWLELIELTHGLLAMYFAP
ncbi:CdaR family transcriptional regulator [Paenibacillus sp. WLX1005]|uniref:CdaR family transcriptional regulator n=1 Tax=Paenibacillus sp. WLX1005 TaxID=3243766 RepID=UPI0039842B8B